MEMVEHNATCKQRFCKIRNTGMIQTFSNDNMVADLVQAFVS